MIYLSEKEVNTMIKQLAQKIRASKLKFHKIIGIANGGLHVSLPLARMLKLSHLSVRISRYDGQGKRLKPIIAGTLAGERTNNLIVDDMIDDGGTMKLFDKYFGLKGNSTAVIFLKSQMIGLYFPGRKTMQLEDSVRLDFKDVLLKPKRSFAVSRKDIELERTFKTLHSQRTITGIPLIAANLDTTGSMDMADALELLNIYTCLHKFYKVDELDSFFTGCESRQTFYTLGTRKEDWDKFEKVSKRVELLFICLDVANCYTENAVQHIKKLRARLPGSVIMAGNVCTADMTQELILNGTDIVKVGIGSGAFCTTRLMTGVGIPQLSAVMECADAAHGLGGLICSDGGCKTPADIVKAFCAGADFVMLGNMLAGTNECDGERYDGKLEVYGMSSKEAQLKHYNGIPDYRASEGRCVQVPLKGPVSVVLQEILGGMRSAGSYIGATCLKDFSKCATFVRVL